MTRGRSGDRTYTGHNGAREQNLRAMGKLAKTSAGQAGRVAAPSPEALRTFIESQTCPWCGRGAWKSLGRHTQSAHGVSASDLRTMAGLIKSAPICSQDLSSRHSERMAGKRLPPSAYERDLSAPRHYSEAGLAVLRAKFDASRSPEQARRASAARVAKVTAENAPKYEEILRLFGEGLLIKDIADRVGVSLPTVRSTLERHGLADDLQKRRWQALGPERREAHMERLRTAILESLKKETADLVARFNELGATSDAVRLLAKQQGITTKSMAHRLRKAGADVPDGRREGRSRFTEADRQRMSELYAEGLSQSQVAVMFEASQKTVSEILRKQGVAIRPFAHTKNAT